MKKGKSAGVDNIAELVQAGGEDIITALTTIGNKIWQTGEWRNPWTQSLVITHQCSARQRHESLDGAVITFRTATSHLIASTPHECQNCRCRTAGMDPLVYSSFFSVKVKMQRFVTGIIVDAVIVQACPV